MGVPKGLQILSAAGTDVKNTWHVQHLFGDSTDEIQQALSWAGARANLRPGNLLNFTEILRVPESPSLSLIVIRDLSTRWVRERTQVEEKY